MNCLNPCCLSALDGLISLLLLAAIIAGTLILVLSFFSSRSLAHRIVWRIGYTVVAAVLAPFGQAGRLRDCR